MKCLLKSSTRMSSPVRLPSLEEAVARSNQAMLSEFEMKRCEKLVAEFVQQRRPPPHLRAKVDLAFRVSGQSIEIFELRPHWMNKAVTLESPLPKPPTTSAGSNGKSSGNVRT